MSRLPLYEHDYEPSPGLPADLPKGEYILWQGRPSARSVARRALKTRWFALYFLALFGWAVASGLHDGASVGGVLFSAGALAALACVVIGLAELYAYGVERTTLYTITNKRVVMRIGVALSGVLNLPFAQIESAAHKAHDGETGDIALKLKGGARISWLLLWPHARPFRFRTPEPSLRCIPDSARVAGLLAAALRTATAEPEISIRITPEPAMTPAFAAE